MTVVGRLEGVVLMEHDKTKEAVPTSAKGRASKASVGQSKKKSELPMWRLRLFCKVVYMVVLHHRKQFPSWPTRLGR